MKRLLFVFTVLLLAGTTEVYSQGWLEKVAKKTAKRVEERSKKKVEDKVNEAADKTVDKAFGKAEDAVTGKGNTGSDNTTGGETEDTNENAEEGGKQAKKSSTMNCNKFDFVAGDEVMFDDQLAGEKLGEFPSQWDLKSGYAEVAQIDGKNAIYMTEATKIMPLMKEKNYLPDVFTIEFEVYVPTGRKGDGNNAQTGNYAGGNSRYNIDLIGANGKNVFQIYWYNPWSFELGDKTTSVNWEWYSGGERSTGEMQYIFKYRDFNRVSISFNKRAMKVYLNETRVVNIPRCDAPTSFNIYAYQGEKENRFIKNVRIAKGAVPLYDRMMSDGKFITYGITFDVGKSVIKPESMGEINRIVKLMTENPDLKFSVEGHTDSTGNAANNQTLSEARSKAIVDKLVEMGIAADRLASAGKGQANPIADNATDEGRAKNRRVEFVKI